MCELTLKTPKIKITDIQLFERDVILRLPFRFGVVTLTEAPQAFVKVTIEGEDGQTEIGGSAELMVPKWFDKSPDLTNEDNFNQLRLSLNRARECYLADNDVAKPAFQYFADNYAKLVFNDDLNPLAASFGPAVIDKAVLDALCRLNQVSFDQAIRQNLPGMDMSVLAPDLAGFDTAGFLAGLSPQEVVHARHTVGLLDPLAASDQPDGPTVNDGLPETLEQVIDIYGHHYFKVKVGGNHQEDIARLIKIAAVLDRKCEDYTVTLDGNEQYEDVGSVLTLWDAITSTDELENFAGKIILVEQPIKRSAALSTSIENLAKKIPVIIDESDGEIGTFLQAKKLGYTGVSSKSCKGFYKSIINAARCAQWNAASGDGKYFMSAEDLTCQAGIAVQQDLALISLLGITHVERNGHHYVNGMAGASQQEQEKFLAAHSDLYGEINGRTCTQIKKGLFSIASLQCAGFATSVLPDWSALTEMKISHQ